MKAFENHQRREGEAVSHGTAKELLAGFAVNLFIQFITDVRVSRLTASSRTRASIGSISMFPVFDYANYLGRRYVQLRLNLTSRPSTRQRGMPSICMINIMVAKTNMILTCHLPARSKIVRSTP